MKEFKKIDKKYALKGSYFKNKLAKDPDTILDIVSYFRQYDDLPFRYEGNNFVYDALCERQRYSGIQNDQYMTPDELAIQMTTLANNFMPEDLSILEACCGTGQLTKYLIKDGFNVYGFDNDKELVELCNLLYPQGKFYELDFREAKEFTKHELIISNPPLQIGKLHAFMEWLSLSLSERGKAILLLPSEYLEKNYQKKFKEVLSRFISVHKEEPVCNIPNSTMQFSIFILELEESYKKLAGNNTSTDNNVVENHATTLDETDNTVITHISINNIIPDPKNRRKEKKQEEILELASNISEHGLINPISVRLLDDKYVIICGERRYLAFKLLSKDFIPCIIRDFTEIQAEEMSFSENLNRKDLSPIEEALGFNAFIEEHNYTITDLKAKFGKSENYIRQRIRLLNLIPDFQKLVGDNQIIHSVALELTKYSPEIQQSIYEEHFRKDDATSWKDIGCRDFKARVERTYTTDLGLYAFDKTDCLKCYYNTALYEELFPDSENKGRCTKPDCLQKKRTEFTIGFCKTIKEKLGPEIEICKRSYDNVSVSVNEAISEAGFMVEISNIEKYPSAPSKPISENFKSATEFDKAMEEYKIEELAHASEMDEIEEKVEKGEYKKCIYIGDNNPTFGYIKLKDSRYNSNTGDKVENLNNQEAGLKEDLTKAIMKDLSGLLNKSKAPEDEISQFEEELQYYFMLDYIDSKFNKLFGFSDKQKLTCVEKFNIVKALKPEHKIFILRQFLIKCIIKSPVNAVNASFIISLSSQYHPADTKTITSKHQTDFQKKYKAINKQKENLKKKNKVAEPV